jgi:endonuclease G
VFDGFVASYDPRLRNPRWVLERITRDSFTGDGDRFNVQFMEDGAIEERFRARLSDYKASGYDKGHLVPAANHKASQQSVVDTFSLTNIAPQVRPRAINCAVGTVDQKTHP